MPERLDSVVMFVVVLLSNITGHMVISSIYYQALPRCADVGSNIPAVLLLTTFVKLWEFHGTPEGCWSRTRWYVNTTRGIQNNMVTICFYVEKIAFEDQTAIDSQTLH